jgi:hypothetical protein
MSKKTDLGLRVGEIARPFFVSPNWYSYRDALRVGAEVFDSGVERALAERAMGYLMSLARSIG